MVMAETSRQGMNRSGQLSTMGLVMRQKEPRNLEGPFDHLDSFLTPSELFHIRSHFPTPRLDVASYRLEIGGAVERPLSLNYEELRRMPSETRVATLQLPASDRGVCRRSEFVTIRRSDRLRMDFRRLFMKPLELAVTKRIWTRCLVAVAMAASLAAKPALASDDADLLKEAQGLFKPLPKDMATAEFPVGAERVRLGRMLFFDPRISADGTLSCSRCHLPALYATDGLPRSVGVHGQSIPRNSPTVLNSALFFKEHWDGRFANVEEQAKVALLGPAFGNPDYPTAMARVKAITGYAEMFRTAFPGDRDPVTEDNWGTAIGAYERTLVSPSRFDEYLGGKSDALSPAERNGLRTFIKTGCVECHRGAGLGGQAFRKIGVFSDYWKATGSQEVDKGRFGVTNDSADLYKFKVASLRNVVMTPPYFHDGAVASLSKAVRIMAKVQLDADLSEPDADAIVTFLGCLTGSLPEGFERAPALPAGGFGPPASARSRGRTN